MQNVVFHLAYPLEHKPRQSETISSIFDREANWCQRSPKELIDEALKAQVSI